MLAPSQLIPIPVHGRGITHALLVYCDVLFAPSVFPLFVCLFILELLAVFISPLMAYTKPQLLWGSAPYGIVIVHFDPCFGISVVEWVPVIL